MRRCGWLSVLAALAVAGCAPQQIGEQVGQSLYRASVGTGNAIAAVGDRTGQALENAGASLRGTDDPRPTVTPPPFYGPPGYSQVPNSSQPVSPQLDADPPPVTREDLPPRQQMGY